MGGGALLWVIDSVGGGKVRVSVGEGVGRGV